MNKKDKDVSEEVTWGINCSAVDFLTSEMYMWEGILCFYAAEIQISLLELDQYWVCETDSHIHKQTGTLM